MLGKMNFIESLRRAFGLPVPHIVVIESTPALTTDRPERRFVCGTMLHWGEEARLQKVAEELREAQKNSSTESSIGLDQYRDDRIFIMKLSSDFKHNEDGSIVSSREFPSSDLGLRPMLLVTYRNTEPLQPVKADNFSSLADAMAYIRKIEPACPRVSLGGRPPEPPLSWQEHLAWLHKQGLSSAAIGE